MILEINSLKTKIKNNTSLEEFNLGIKEIIKQVEYKNKPLYGECNDPDCD
jgi:hypothetical protein